MAIYHLHGKVFSRSKGHSAVASAAYRAGECLQDERANKEQDYTRKGGVVHKEIIAPDNAQAWAQDRGALWNKVEATERRKDSQLAREIEVAIPRELPREKQVELVREFCRDNFVCKGMIADIAMHEGVASDGGKNPHAHIMLTMRDLLEDGSGFDKKNRTWNETHQLEEWRENWAKAANGYIEDFNKQAELSTEQVAPIDHRSYAEQGLELQPTQHMGKEATALEKQGIETDIGKANRVIEHVNRAVLFARASMASARDYAVEFYSQMKERVQVSARTLEHSEIQHVQIAGLAWNEEKEHEIGDYER